VAACDRRKQRGWSLAIARFAAIVAIGQTSLYLAGSVGPSPIFAEEPAATAPAAEIAASAATSPGAPDFERQIAPLLIKNCVKCHNGSDPAGELNLTTREGILAAGDSSEASVVPGQPEKSYLIQRLTDGEMPPKGKSEPLSAEQVALISTWIASGAAWPEGRTLSMFELTTKDRAGRDWWSLAPPRRPEVPQPAHADRVRTPIDAFILSRLETAGLEPAPETDRATLIRRAMFDVWGLPPDPAEVDAFVADPDPAAYEHLVERLLASPHYGERWAQHWLDVVRFAESHGFETNSERGNAWPFRDYVIRAINDDIPYPQFIREQLAGDQVGAPTATGFLVAGPFDGVGSPNEELTRQQRHQVLDDMVSTIGQGFLAMTVSCAKCHDHKFDVISQRDYYALQALVAGVKHGERDLNLELPPERKQEIDAIRTQLAVDEGKIRSLRASAEPLARLDLPISDPAALRASVQVAGNMDRFAPIAARFVRFTILTTNQSEPCVDELEIFATDDGRNVALASAGGVASASSVLAEGKNVLHQVAHINDGQYGNERSWIPAETEGSWIQIEFAEPIKIDRIEWARDRKRGYTDRIPLTYRIEVAEKPGEWQLVATGDDRRPFAPQDPPPSPETGLSEEVKVRLAEIKAEQESLTARLESVAPGKVFVGNFEAPHSIFRLHRGEVMQRKETVAPGTPALVGTPVALAEDASDVDRRLALANWLGSEANPLAARVMVNRIWQHHFGRGLVRSPSDFGFNGGLPSHAALLDWLATEFIANEWRPKHLHRLILLSSAYRQSSQSSPAAAAADGDNELVWRFRPQRLDAEEIHDAILAASGVLDLAPGGPGYLIYEPNPTSYVKVYIPKVLGPKEWRRMIYQNKPRMRPEPTFGAFDCPDGSASMARRNVSTTALQSLNLLNSAFMVQQSKLFAERLTREHPGQVDEQIHRGLRLAFCRSAEPDELAAARQLVAEHGLEQFCRTLLNANEFIYIR
jgi:mono/diheme cytochrome c family protein